MIHYYSKLFAFALLPLGVLLSGCPGPVTGLDCSPGVKAVCEKYGRVCGYSGCGDGAASICGECDAGESCSQDGKCGPAVCDPICVGDRECGDDGCGGSCGDCPTDRPTCTDGVCIAACKPQCDGKICGDDTCGGLCGTCAAGLACGNEGTACAPEAWTCDAGAYNDAGVCDCACGAVDPDCTLASMSSNDIFLAGCQTGEICDAGACVPRVPAGWTCSPDQYQDGNLCHCDCGVPDPDCEEAARPVLNCLSEQCNTDGTCVACTPQCDGKNCGGDKCGGLCLPVGPQPTTGPTAPSGGGCLNGGLCLAGVCTNPCGSSPILCQTNECGNDGCGGSCGTCTGGKTCQNGACALPNVPPADDSCVGRCGNEAPSGCMCDAPCAGRNDCCADRATACCVPSCINKACGSDGCGGECGTCGANNSCSVDQCVPNAPTALEYPNNPVTYFVGITITNNSPSVGGGAVASFSVSPALPAGLVLSTTTGTISGAPTASSAATGYTVTATNVTGFTTRVVTITVAEPPPLGLTYSTTTASYVRNQMITANTPSSTGGAVASYSVSPALPTGLSLNTMTGVITGTPTVLQAASTYTITATNANGSTDFVLTISVVLPPAPSNLVYSTNPALYTEGTAIMNNSPTTSGGTPTGYAVVPALPASLVLNPTTGVISGTPGASGPSGTYVVTASNDGGDTTANLQIRVRPRAPSGLTYSEPMPIVYTQGAAIDPNTPSFTLGSASSFTVMPALPTGLTLDPSTGVITGTPTVTLASALYVVTATNETGSTMASLDITVNPGVVAWAQQAFVKASNNGASHAFGTSVATAGNLLVVGSPWETTAPDTGAAYVYRRTGSAWAEEAQLKVNNSDFLDPLNFGESVAVSGTTIVVGAPGEDTAVADSGAAFVYFFNGTSWTLQGTLKASDAAGSAFFGCDVAIDGDTIVVGARNVGVGGASYVYTRSAGTWTQQQKLVAPNPSSGDQFGQSVTISADTLIVGAFSEDGLSPIVHGAAGPTGTNDNGDATNAGAAYVYTRSGGVWTLQAYLKASNVLATGQQQFGASVSLSGDTAVIGANGENSAQTFITNGPTAPTDEDAAGSGAAYVFRRTTGVWAQQAYLKASNADELDAFGSDVSISGNTVVVGAPAELSLSTLIANGPTGGVGSEDDSALFSAGAAYVFFRTGSAWAQTAYLKAPNSDSGDEYGLCVSTSGTTVVVGARGESSAQTTITNGPTAPTDNTNSGSGAAYVVTQ